jgi:uncharacterized RDD family membrane protein YckC
MVTARRHPAPAQGQGGARLETFRALRRRLTGGIGLESSTSGGPRPAEPSAAQNGTVIQTCRHCGASHGADATVCDVCRALLTQNDSGRGVSSGESARTSGNLAMAPDWRNEVSQRLQAYRKRQRRLREDPAQPELVFSQEHGSAASDSPVQTQAAHAASATIVETAAPAMPRHAYRSSEKTATPIRRTDRATSRSRVERVEIDLLQPSLDFSAKATSPASERGASWHPVMVSPMASLRERRLAATVDAALLLSSFGSFLALFWALGGRLAASKVDALVLAATLSLFYAQYIALFTFFGGSTPGMMWRGLRLVRFDGHEPQLGDRVWRSIGYLVSAGTLMLGFMWALWDEDHLCWHDRISHTHLTWTNGMHEALGGEVSVDFESQQW